MLRGGACGCKQDKVVDRHLRLAGGFCGGIDLLAKLGEGSGIDLDGELKMRDLGFAGEEALGNRAAHSRERDPLVAG